MEKINNSFHINKLGHKNTPFIHSFFSPFFAFCFVSIDIFKFHNLICSTYLTRLEMFSNLFFSQSTSSSLLFVFFITIYPIILLWPRLFIITATKKNIAFLFQKINLGKTTTLIHQLWLIQSFFLFASLNERNWPFLFLLLQWGSYQ